MALVASAIIGAGLSAAQMFSGAKRRREAREALENYQRQEFTNVADELSVYTKGAEMRQEEMARLGASSVDAMSRAGTRGVIGGVGQLTQQQQIGQRDIAAGLEEQQARIDQVRATDEARIRQMQEQRERDDIAALSSQFQQGENMFASGLSGLGQVGMGLTSGIMNKQMNQNYLDAMYGNNSQPQGAGASSQFDIFNFDSSNYQIGQ